MKMFSISACRLQTQACSCSEALPFIGDILMVSIVLFKLSSPNFVIKYTGFWLVG